MQNVLTKYRDFDPDDYEGELGLVLRAYDCSCGCIDETVWDLEQLERSIADKFRLALIGCMTIRGYDEAAYRVIVEPDHVGCTQYAVFIAGTDWVILRDGYKAWHFGHDAGTLDDLEAFFSGLVETVPRYGIRKYDDLYGLLDDVEAEIGWACTVDGLAALVGKSAEYRNGEGPDPLDDGDTRWEFAILDAEKEEVLHHDRAQYKSFSDAASANVVDLAAAAKTTNPDAGEAVDALCDAAQSALDQLDRLVGYEPATGDFKEN